MLYIFVYFQVTSESNIENALNVTKDKFGRLDVAVNCAGIGVAFKTYNFNKNQPHKIEDFIRVLTVSIFYLTSIVSRYKSVICDCKL